jgi:AcrR family transcriptional regulator
MPKPRVPRGRGHARQLSRDRIVAAALPIARERGERALSMRALAAALDVDPAALYWHFRNKEDLLAELARAAAAAVPLGMPPPGPWRERALTLCRSIRDRLLDHPELGLQEGGSPWATPFNARANGLLVEVLSASGLTGPPLLLAAQGLLHTVTALAQSQVLTAASTPDEIRRFVHSVGHELPDPGDDAWRELAREPVSSSFDALFDLTLGALLDGIALRT